MGRLKAYVCDNLADHMVGNVYVQFREEEYAAKALKNLSGRYYAGLPIIVDFSPVTDFQEGGTGGTREQALSIEENVAEDTGVQFGKVVNKDGPKLSNRTGKGNKQNSVRRMMMVSIITMGAIIIQGRVTDTTISSQSNMSTELFVCLLSG
ncbi:hypothetical protein L6452_00239 [Arctium lappa]|uniref:Uncharacterized protein n=1 Tax=Arctium lappa TaxID=4217 RepID=A0ACB9FCX4_ARCLA|nr:hypothetical protein L6452_00239 [Arctium lappa]